MKTSIYYPTAILFIICSCKTNTPEKKTVEINESIQKNHHFNKLVDERLFFITGNHNYPKDFSGICICIFDMYVGKRSIFISENNNIAKDTYLYVSQSKSGDNQIDSVKIYHRAPLAGWDLFKKNINDYKQFSKTKKNQSNETIHDGTYFVIDVVSKGSIRSRINTPYCKNIGHEIIDFVISVKNNFPDKRLSLLNKNWDLNQFPYGNPFDCEADM